MTTGTECARIERPAPAVATGDECPRLRPDVSSHPYARGKRSAARSHVIRSVSANNYVITSALGVGIIDCLDGTRNPQQIADHLRGQWKVEIPLVQISEFLDICAANGFIEDGTWARDRQIVVPSAARREKLGIYSKVYNADELLDVILEYRRWWLNPVTKALAGALLVVGIASLFLIPEGGGLIAPIRQLDMTFTDVFILLLPFAFLLELAVHELAHALACRLMGARPKGFGCGLLWGIMPILFTDTTDAYTIASKRKRMFVSFAGPMTDLMWLGLVMLLYWSAPSGSLSAKLLLAYSAFPLTSIVLSLNPFFIRMDGYWILADWLDQPNLRRASARYLKSMWRRSTPPGAGSMGAAGPPLSDRICYVGYALVATAWTSCYLGYVFFASATTLIALIQNFQQNSIYS